jgi:hypothetical protein
MSHPDGKSKAKFFREFGFSDSNAHILETGLISIAQTEEVETETKSTFGVKYVIDGKLMTPSGITVKIRTVWIIETGDDAPRFVTAHPISRN